MKNKTRITLAAAILVILLFMALVSTKLAKAADMHCDATWLSGTNYTACVAMQKRIDDALASSSAHYAPTGRILPLLPSFTVSSTDIDAAIAAQAKKAQIEALKLEVQRLTWILAGLQLQRAHGVAVQ